MDFTTPMMKQYADIKAQYSDCLLFFRLGDFYELFMEDAKIGAAVMDITLTARSRGRDGDVPMAGVPYHSVDSYITKCIKAGYKVAICEQLTDPNGTDLVERGVVRVVTPGTVTDDKSLESKNNNYVCILCFEHNILGVAYADVSTGHFCAYEVPIQRNEKIESIASNEIFRIQPAECLLPSNLHANSDFMYVFERIPGMLIFSHQSQIQNPAGFLKNHFSVSNLISFGLENKPKAVLAAAQLIDYLKYTQKDKLSHIKKIVSETNDIVSALDWATINNLEVFTTVREGSKKGSLLNTIDRTKTPMGGRLLKSWITKPLISEAEILKRHDFVEFLVNNSEVFDTLSETLRTISDVERLLSKLALGIGNPRDLINLAQNLNQILKVKTILLSVKSELCIELTSLLSSDIGKIAEKILSTINEDPPVDPKSGGFIRAGISDSLDELTKTLHGSKTYILELEQREKERSGINSLKVRFNQVFGYYIEITKSNLHNVPSDYFRKQTLVNAERFFTPELKEREETIMNAESKSKELEYELFNNLVSEILNFTESIQKSASSVSQVDVLVCFAQMALEENYVKPSINTNNEIYIKANKHPVVDKVLGPGKFVPNDVCLDKSNQLLIITGPNMGGKSVYIRQVAISCLLNQIGCFVPAQSANMCVVDKIFVRSGASDVITAGLSTFMLEMTETAFILNHATSKSLIILDEIGRGTSTYDGVSLAWGVAEYLVNKDNFSPKTLFATHYHELQKLEEEFPNKVKNYTALVKDTKDSPVFLHQIVLGKSSHSYGIEVGNLAGLPKEVLVISKKVLKSLESIHQNRVNQ